jgi:ketosteroid isomerase-like protein
MRIIVTVVFTIIVLLIPSVALSAQQPNTYADTNSIVEGEIKAFESRLAELIVHGAWEEYASHVMTDYIHTRENGKTENKEEAVASLHDVNRRVIFREMEPSNLFVHVYGDAAICNAEFTMTVRDSGQVKTRSTRETDVFVKRDGQWWLAASHSSMIGK